MPNPHWLDQGAAGLSYSGGAGGMKPAMPAKPMTPPKPPALGASKVPGAGIPSVASTQTPAAPSVAPTGAGGTPSTGAGTAPRTWTGFAMAQGENALNGWSAYTLGKHMLSKATPTITQTATKTIPSVASRVLPAATNLATKATPWAARAALPLYGAYSVADGALLTPYRLATGQENLQGLQQQGIQNGYLSNVGSNMARPGRSAWGMLDATQDGIRTAVREYFRGRQLDAAPRPPQPEPWSGAGAMTGGGEF